MPRRRGYHYRRGGGTPTGTPPATTLGVAASTAAVTVQISQAGTSSTSVALTTSGPPLHGPTVSNLTYGTLSGWLTATVASISSGWQLNLIANPTVLTVVGTYTATVTLGDTTTVDAPTVVVTATVIADPNPKMGLSDNTDTVTATVGGASPSPITINLMNVGGGGSLGTTTTFSKTYGGTSTGWLTETYDNVNHTATFTFDTSAIVVSGSSTCAIVFVDTNANNECIYTATLQMGTSVGVPTLKVSPSNLSFTLQQGSNVSVASIAVSNGAANGTFADLGTIGTSIISGAWITSAVNGGVVNVTFATSALSAGSYSGKVRVTSSTATNSPVDVPVDIVVQAVGPLPDPTLPTEYAPSRPSVTGATFTCATAAQLTTALATCVRGDQIVLTAGNTFTGNFTLRSLGTTAASGWVTIRSSLDTSMPSGVRVRPSVSAQYMPKIISPNAAPSLKTAPGTGCSGYWICGLEFDWDQNYTGIGQSNMFLGDGSGAQNSLSLMPQDIVIERCYLHRTKPAAVAEGATQTVVQRSIALNCGACLIRDSWITDGRGPQVEAQAIGGWNGSGPFSVINNHLQAGCEVLLYGGADPAIAGLNPADIVVRGNYIYSPLAYKGIYLKKNILEIKKGHRWLVERNVLDGSWTSGQVGYAFVIWCVNQGGTQSAEASPPGPPNIGDLASRTTNVTVRQNLIMNTGAGYQITASSTGIVAACLDTILIEDNYMTGINTPQYPGAGFSCVVYGTSQGPIQNYKVRRNTWVAGTGGTIIQALTFDKNGVNGKSANNFEYRDNLSQFGTYGIFSSYGQGVNAFSANCTGQITQTGNVLIGTSPGGAAYPAPAAGGFTFVATEAAGNALGKGIAYSTIQNLTSGVIVAP